MLKWSLLKRSWNIALITIQVQKTAYEKGVKAAIEQWGAAMPADYFTIQMLRITAH